MPPGEIGFGLHRAHGTESSMTGSWRYSASLTIRQNDNSLFRGLPLYWARRIPWKHH